MYGYFSVQQFPVKLQSPGGPPITVPTTQSLQLQQDIIVRSQLQPMFQVTVKTLNIGTPRPATVVVLNIKQFNFSLN